MTQQQANSSELRIYFGYNLRNSTTPDPIDALQSANQVIRAMSDLIQGYRDPNEFGLNPDGDVRAGIRHIFEACAQQIDVAVDELHRNSLTPEQSSYPILKETNSN